MNNQMDSYLKYVEKHVAPDFVSRVLEDRPDEAGLIHQFSRLETRCLFNGHSQKETRMVAVGLVRECLSSLRHQMSDPDDAYKHLCVVEDEAEYFELLRHAAESYFGVEFGVENVPIESRAAALENLYWMVSGSLDAFLADPLQDEETYGDFLEKAEEVAKYMTWDEGKAGGLVKRVAENYVKFKLNFADDLSADSFEDAELEREAAYAIAKKAGLDISKPF